MDIPTLLVFRWRQDPTTAPTTDDDFDAQCHAAAAVIFSASIGNPHDRRKVEAAEVDRDEWNGSASSSEMGPLDGR